MSKNHQTTVTFTPNATTSTPGIVKLTNTISTDDTVVPTSSAVKNAIPPKGTIVSFSGTFGGPDGRHPIDKDTKEANLLWQICDGQNDTPNLLDKFILGSDTFQQGITGGGDSTEGHAITIAEMPPHSHEIEVSTGSSGSLAYRGGDERQLNIVTSSVGEGKQHIHKQVLPPFYRMAYITQV